jgi:hypothetical protein
MKSPSKLSIHELRALRLRAQCLFPRLPKTELVNVVKAVCGVQSQLQSAMELALRARVKVLTVEDIDQSRVHDRSLVLTWCMRGSMHLLTTDDLEAMLSAIAPSDITAGWRWFEHKHNIPRDQVNLMLDEAYNILKTNGTMTRDNLIEAIAAKHGSMLKRAGFGVVWLNGMLGRICFGKQIGTQPTFVILDDWLGHPISLSKPDYVELARRYLRGYGPATVQDFAAWWGLSLTEAKKAWKSLTPELTEFTVEGQSVWSLSADEKTDIQGHNVCLIPAFDTYLLGYRNRDAAVLPDDQKRIFHGGQTVPAVLVDGCAAGTWRYERRTKQFRVTVEAFSSFAPEIRDLLASEVDDIAASITSNLTFTLPQIERPHIQYHASAVCCDAQ